MAKLANIASQTLGYCSNSTSAMTLLSLVNDTETNKSVWQALFASFATHILQRLKAAKENCYQYSLPGGQAKIEATT